MRYQGLVLREIGKDPCLTQLELRSPLNDNQVLVKVLNTGICGKQLEEISGANGKDIYIPHCLGHEGAGIVIDIGKSVKNVMPGDSVVLHWITEFDCGHHVTPLIYDLQTNEYINCGPITTFSEYTVVLCNRLTKIEANVKPEIASLLGCGLTTGLGSVFNEARVSRDDSVLVVGCGGVGISVIQGCKIAGAKEVVAVDLSQEALLQASLSGATNTFNSREDGWQERAELSNFNVIFYCIASGQLLKDIHRFLSVPSRTFIVGVPDPKTEVTLRLRDIHSRRAVLGSYGGLTKPSRDIPTYLNMIEKGLLNPNLLLGLTFSLENYSDAFANARTGRGKRIQLIP